MNTKQFLHIILFFFFVLASFVQCTPPKEQSREVEHKILFGGETVFRNGVQLNETIVSCVGDDTWNDGLRIYSENISYDNLTSIFSIFQTFRMLQCHNNSNNNQVHFFDITLQGHTIATIEKIQRILPSQCDCSSPSIIDDPSCYTDYEIVYQVPFSGRDTFKRMLDNSYNFEGNNTIQIHFYNLDASVPIKYACIETIALSIEYHSCTNLEAYCNEQCNGDLFPGTCECNGEGKANVVCMPRSGSQNPKTIQLKSTNALKISLTTIGFVIVGVISLVYALGVYFHRGDSDEPPTLPTANPNAVPGTPLPSPPASPMSVSSVSSSHVLLQIAKGKGRDDDPQKNN